MSSLLRTGLSLVCRPLVASCLPLLWATTLASMPTKAAATDLAPLATQPLPTPGYVQQLQQQARASHLAQAPAWRQLLHYARQPLSGRDRSLADDPGFFLSPEGHTDLQAELDATLATLADPRPIHALDQPAACRFIARAQWLRQQLNVDPAQWPEADCPRYQQWRQGIRAQSVTLVFPSAYINSPASMYGHTFLRLDPPPTPRGQRPLLSYSINYAANGSDADGFSFAVRGLTGLYAGQFSTAPYYSKLTEYNDLENRDVWEYTLRLDADEIDRLMAHTWELGPTRFDYYFFDENCAYHLLSLLDVARPGLNLTDPFVWRAIPIDTVRAVQRVPGLVKTVTYRPANSSELRARVALLGPELTARARQLADDAAAQRLSAQPLQDLAGRVAPAQQALMLETAERLVAYDGTRAILGDHEAVQAARMRLLGLRAALPPGEPVTVPTPSFGPTDGHDTIRADWQQGQRNGHAQTLLQIRPAYHDLLDPEAGYQRGAAIEFFSLTLGKRSDRPWELEKLVPVAIQSLAPREPWLATPSWRVDVGLVRTAFGMPRTRTDGSAGLDRPLALSLHGGPGRAWDVDGRVLSYVFVDNQLWWDRSLQHRPAVLGSGLAVGTLVDLTPSWRLHTEAFARGYLGGALQERGALLATRWSMSHAWNLTGQCQWQWRQQDGQALQGDRLCTLGLQRYW